METGENGWHEEERIPAGPDGLSDMLRCMADQDSAALYVLVDAARDNTVLARLADSKSDYQSLFTTQKLSALMRVGPFLVSCREDASLLAWFTAKAWGNASILFLTSQAPRDQLTRHLQTCFSAVTPDDRELFFRYYDPRSLRTYLPTCTPQEAWRFMGPVRRIMVESNDAACLCSFRRDILCDRPPDDAVVWKQPIFIRSAQMAHFRRDAAQRFRQRIKGHLQSGLAAQIATKNLNDAALVRLVADGIDRSRMYGIRRESDVQRYIEYMLVLDPEFDLDPAFDWAGAILFTNGISGTEKMDRMDRAVALQMMASAADSLETV